VGLLLRHHPTAATWSMIEVMLVGVFVALIKIADYATVVPGTALFALIALVFLQAAIEASFDRRVMWSRVAWQAEAEAEAATAPVPRGVPA
jgi:paraquat-inducible protein A